MAVIEDSPPERGPEVSGSRGAELPSKKKARMDLELVDKPTTSSGSVYVKPAGKGVIGKLFSVVVRSSANL